MNGDSDEEIRTLRAAALLTRSSTMRKRKVTVINSRNIITGENDSDKRQILASTRTVVVGSKRASPIQSQKVSTTASKNDDDSDSQWPRAVMDTFDSYPPKKPKLQTDRRILTISENQVKSGKDQRIFAVEGKIKEEDVSLFEHDEDIDSDTDVRIILSDDSGQNAEDDVDKEENELLEIKYKDENIVELDASIDIDESASEDVTFLEERLPLRRVERKNSEEKVETDEVDVEDETEEVEEDEEEQEEPKERQDLEENSVEKQVEQKVEEQEEEKSEEEGEEKVVKDKKRLDVQVSKEEKETSVSQKERKTEEKLKEQSVKDKKIDEIHVEKGGNKSIKKENSKSLEEEKGGRVETKEKTAERTDTSKKQDQKKSAPTSQKSSDDESSGSESDSSHSSGSSSTSSSSYSSSSSSSRTSSGSRRSSGSKSDSDSDDEQRSRSKKSSRSRSHSSHSSSYSYSTRGSAEKTTMRSVVSQRDRDFRRSRSPRRSPRGRWSPRDPRYSNRRQSYGSDDRYSRARRNGRTRRDESPRYTRRRSPHSRLGKRAPSTQRFSPRYRNRSRERERPRDTRFNRYDEKPRRRQTRSKSPDRRKDSASDKNNLSRTDDDFVEIDVRQKLSVRESGLKNSGRSEGTKVGTKAREPGFDLRSKLGPKKSETKLVITKTNQTDARQKIKRKTQEVIEILDDEKEKVHEEEVEEIYVEDSEQNGKDEEYETFGNSSVVEVQNNKEAQLDAKILRIQQMNEKIRKRQEEIEREKMFYG